MGKARHAIILGSGLLLAAATLDGGEPIRLRVSPAVGTAPGFLTVRVSVESVADDRFLEVVAESPDFYRSSQISIDARNASRLNVFEFRNLPTGLYSITGVVVGVHGPRATASSLAKVEPSPGR
jgi:hypothetical protein